MERTELFHSQNWCLIFSSHQHGTNRTLSLAELVPHIFITPAWNEQNSFTHRIGASYFHHTSMERTELFHSQNWCLIFSSHQHGTNRTLSLAELVPHIFITPAWNEQNSFTWRIGASYFHHTSMERTELFHLENWCLIFSSHQHGTNRTLSLGELVPHIFITPAWNEQNSFTWRIGASY